MSEVALDDLLTAPILGLDLTIGSNVIGNNVFGSKVGGAAALK